MRERLKDWLGRLAWMALSVPIFIKILGIGLLVTILFGSVVFFQIKVGMFRTHYQIHGETALSLALALAGRLEPALKSEDDAAMNQEVNETMGEFPDIRYIVVQNPEGKILSHGFTFPREAPSDLIRNRGDLCSSCHSALSPKELPSDLLEVPAKTRLSMGHLRAYSRDEGLILEVSVPIADGSKGLVRLGVGDRVITREIASITYSLLWSLTLCVAVGLSLALLLAYILVKPIHTLVQATNRLRENDFSARARVFAKDEIGHLAAVFNQMAEGLERYQHTVREQEAGRRSLIGKIVQAQEDERKSVARELHDQLGQMLSKVLLSIDSSCDSCLHRSGLCGEIRSDIRAMIDDVRRLAWNVRPSILDDYGLDRALARYIDETQKRVDFSIDYQCAFPPDKGRLPSQIEVTLYRIAQEAITNIIRHAGATQASVILLSHDREVTLIIEDNGCGFDLANVEHGGHPPLGIIGMKERAELVGGELVVDSQPGKGATIHVRIPTETAEISFNQLVMKKDADSGAHSG